jgi:hypothetical protein
MQQQQMMQVVNPMSNNPPTMLTAMMIAFLCFSKKLGCGSGSTNLNFLPTTASLSAEGGFAGS